MIRSSPNSSTIGLSSSTQTSSFTRSSLAPTTTATLEGSHNPFTQKQSIKSKKPKRQQGSSRFCGQMSKDLEPLPLIKGNFFILYFLRGKLHFSIKI